MEISMKKHTLEQRSAGVLLPISSLPGAYGIGTLGREAYHFVDCLKKAGQTYWQVLPVGPTSFGDSPYQSFSAFAGNPYMIDLEQLMDEGLLRRKEVEELDWGADPEDIRYDLLFENRFSVLRLAYSRSGFKKEREYQTFTGKNKYWLADYCLYMALKFHFQNQEWLRWEEDIRFHRPEAVQYYGEKLQEEIDFWSFCQYKFFQQWNRLKKYAHKKHIYFIGDIPLYVSLDSADVWAHPELFQLDENRRPTKVAGVPPDCFSADGQRWGNPLYNWKVMESDGFKWWSKRMKANARLFDVIRIDHFIGIVNYWSIPADCPTAVDGQWIKGPGKKLTDVIRKATKGVDIIAEDLGVVGPNVRKLIRKTGWPGMKILEFAFDDTNANEYLPHNFTETNCIIYGGTHDNETLMGFYGAKKPKELKYVMEYLGVETKEQIPDAMIRLGYQSIAATAIFQMQDILGLDNRARMNLPSSVGTNWRWRMLPGAFTKERIRWMKQLTGLYNR